MLIKDENQPALAEEALRDEIVEKYGCGGEEILALREYYQAYCTEPHEKDIWLFIDRPDRADDNAEALFKYVTEKKLQKVEPIFILDGESPEFERLSEMGTVYSFGSREHLQAFLTCKYVFSSQMSESTTNPFNDQFNCVRDIVRQKKIIFLQHGVTKDNNGPIFSRYNRNFYGFITSAEGEYEYMRSELMHYSEEAIWLTGMPRYDRLYDNDQKIITIMPTWRKDLTVRVYDEEQGTMIWKTKDDFTESEYFQFYNSMINDEKLISAAKKNHYKIMFMPHVTFLKNACLFKNNNSEAVNICDYDISYREVFALSSLILTDFSSAVFDFAYLYKPVVYSQFDKEHFYKNHTLKPGYFDYERDGFGEVEYDLDSTVNRLIEYIENDCRLKPEYRARIDRFFTFHDRNCCERIVNKVFELEK